MSIVFGTPTTGKSCSSWSRAATPSVSSPPIATSASKAFSSNVRSTASTPPSSLYGFVRDVPMIVPPRGRIPETSRGPSGSSLPSTSPRQPSRTPMTSQPFVVQPPRDGADDRVQPGAVASAGQDPARIAGILESSSRDAEGGNRTHTPLRAPDSSPARLPVPPLRRALHGTSPPASRRSCRSRLQAGLRRPDTPPIMTPRTAENGRRRRKRENKFKAVALDRAVRRARVRGGRLRRRRRQ